MSALCQSCSWKHAGLSALHGDYVLAFVDNGSCTPRFAFVCYNFVMYFLTWIRYETVTILSACDTIGCGNDRCIHSWGFRWPNAIDYDPRISFFRRLSFARRRADFHVSWPGSHEKIAQTKQSNCELLHQSYWNSLFLNMGLMFRPRFKPLPLIQHLRLVGPHCSQHTSGIRLNLLL